MDVSIIVPVYNNELYIKQCIESLIHQETKVKYEIIAINDGSTDKSLEVLNNYKDQITVIDKKNSGPGDTRNLGLSKSKGKYLMFVDSDDYVASNFVDKMYNKIIQTQADIVICDFYRVHRDDTITYLNKGKEGVYTKDHMNEALLMDFHSCNKIFTRDVIGSLKYPKGMFYEDVVFISEVILNASKVVKINDPLYYYRDNEHGTTNVINDTNYDILKAYEMIENDFINKGYKSEVEFLIIDGILVNLLIRIIKSNIKDKKDVFYKIKNDIEKKYPDWYKNKYLKRCKKTKRIYLYCLRHNFYSIINKVFAK